MQKLEGELMLKSLLSAPVLLLVVFVVAVGIPDGKSLGGRDISMTELARWITEWKKRLRRHFCSENFNRNKRRSVGLAQPLFPLVELPDSQAVFTTKCCHALAAGYLIRYKTTTP